MIEIPDHLVGFLKISQVQEDAKPTTTSSSTKTIEISPNELFHTLQDILFLNLILRVFTSATRATAKILTQAGHVAPKFWCLTFVLSRGR